MSLAVGKGRERIAWRIERPWVHDQGHSTVQNAQFQKQIPFLRRNLSLIHFPAPLSSLVDCRRPNQTTIRNAAGDDQPAGRQGPGSGRRPHGPREKHLHAAKCRVKHPDGENTRSLEFRPSVCRGSARIGTMVPDQIALRNRSTHADVVPRQLNLPESCCLIEKCYRNSSTWGPPQPALIPALQGVPPWARQPWRRPALCS